MASITDIRAALMAPIKALGGINASPYILMNPTPPYAHCFPGGEAGDIEYDLAMQRGLDLMPFTVEVFTGAPGDIAQQVNLDAYLAASGERSIKQAIETDRTLGGLVDDLHVTSAIGYRAVVLPGRNDPLLSATWRVHIYGGIT